MRMHDVDGGRLWQGDVSKVYKALVIHQKTLGFKLQVSTTAHMHA